MVASAALAFARELAELFEHRVAGATAVPA